MPDRRHLILKARGILDEVLRQTVVHRSEKVQKLRALRS
jgi:hypothetical protein